MVRLVFFAIAAALVVSPEVSGARPSPSPQQSKTQDQSTSAPPSATAPGAVAQPVSVNKDQPLQEESRLEILRYVDGEFAHLLTTLPGGKKGFHFRAGEPIDQNGLHKAIQSAGAALNPGDNVQITRLNFEGRDIVIDLNGGGRKQGSWKNHVQMQIGLPTEPVQTSSQTSRTDQAGPVLTGQKTGATFFLDFDRFLPDMTPDQVKQYLSSVLDFSKQRSAAVQYSDTLPPKVLKAITEKRAEVGMDREEILAAIGRPDRKVRERQDDGAETEDWIYGHPPARTIFVRFIGDKVIKVESYPIELSQSRQ
jgi:hypothetical protein